MRKVRYNKVITRERQLPPCIYFKGDNKVFHYDKKLPTISVKHQKILDELSIPYRFVDETHLEFWDKNFYEEELIFLPVYYWFSTRFVWSGLYENISVITKETIKKAQEIETLVNKRIVLKKFSEYSLTIAKGNVVLHNEIALFLYHCTSLVKEENVDAKILHYEFKNHNSIREFHTDKIKVFQILSSKREPSNYYIIFKIDVKQKELNINISQEVLSIIGDCNNWQISYWAGYLGLNKINLICPPD